MPAQLLCIEGSLAGKKVLLEQDKSRRIRIGASEESPLLTFSHEGECWHVESDQIMQLNGKSSQASVLHAGDEINCGDNVFVFESDGIESIDYMAETHAESEDIDDETDNIDGRQRRRISASHQAVIQNPEQQRKGLLSRVGQAFKRRDERLQHLEDLEAQRLEILKAAGRFALENQGGLGLPKEFLIRIFHGETVQLNMSDLSRGAIDQFRKLRDRMLFLDADIDACRLDIGLQAEDRNTLEKLYLRSDREAEEEQAFQAMDAVATTEQEFDLNSASEDKVLDLISSEINAQVDAEADTEEHTDIIVRDRANSEEDLSAQSRTRRRAGNTVRRRRRR